MWINEAETPELERDYVMVIEEILKQRIQGVKNAKGVWTTPAFPKILYVLTENNYKPGTKYFNLTKLAAKCTAKRMVPDYISEKIMKQNKEGNVYGCMGCRSFLSPWKDPETGEYKFWGRLNTGVVTINLPYVALEIKEKYPDWDMNNPEDVSKFFVLLDEYLEKCHKALLQGHKWLEGTKSDVSPILWQNGALARLKPGETIDSKIFGGYSTSSLGFVGLHETMIALTGKPHNASKENKTFALRINKYLSDKCVEWNKIPGQNHGFSLYGTPEESTTYKFAKALQKRFGTNVKGVTDKNYIINSYHIGIKEHVDAFEKLGFEADFQNVTPGGAISYVETGNLTKNIESVVDLLSFIYEHIMYAELNSKLDRCNVCDYEGEIELKRDENNKFYWCCPNCGNTDERTLEVIRRTCGYIGRKYWNQGRTEEIGDRYVHME